MNGTDTFLDINNAHLRVNSGNVQASTFVLDQINIVTSANTNSTVNFNNVTKAFLAASNIEVGTANLFVDTSTSNVGLGTDAPLHTLDVRGDMGVSSNLEVGTANLFVDTSTSNVGIGTNTPQDTLHINGGTRIAGHILPTVNDTYDIGSAEYKIRHLFLGNTSLWLGDETRITFTGGKMKFRRRKKNALPRGLADIAAAQGHSSEQETTNAALAHAGVATIAEMKLEHWIDYTKTLDETKEINDIFTEDANDYEATTASEAFKEIGDAIYSTHNVSIGTTEAPNYTLDVAGDINFTGTLRKGGTEFSGSAWTETGLDAYRSSGNVGIGKTPDAGKKLDVAGTVKATAFEGDGSALTGITSGQWTESGGDIYRSSGNVNLSNLLNLGTHSSAPSNPVNGSIYYNTETNSLELYKNGWVSLTSFAPSDISGLVGWYLPQNWNGSTWVDASGSGNNSASKVGTINYSATQSGGGATNSFPILYGDTSTKINFPSTICPPTYTLIYVTRYYDTQTGRILDSQNNNWLSGHWSGNSGLAYHGGWLTQTASDIHGSNWVLGVDQNYLFRHKSSGVGWSQSTGGGGAYPNLRIGSQGYEPSNWQCAEICVYNRHLSSTEYTQVAEYMEKKFGI